MGDFVSLFFYVIILQKGMVAMRDEKYKILRVYSFSDFCIRCDEIKEFFWKDFAPFMDIALYRDYLLEEAKFSDNKEKQEMYAGFAWEYINDDIDKFILYTVSGKVRRDERNNKNNGN